MTVTGRGLARNSLWALIADYPGYLLKFFVLTPVIINAVGMAGYGVWALVFGICQYIEQFNMSFGFAYSKFAAEYDANKDYDGLSAVVSSGILLVAGAALPVAATIFLLRDAIFSLLKIGPVFREDATAALLLVIASLVIRMTYGCYARLLTGIHRYDLEKKLHLGGDLIYFTLAMILLHTLGGITGLAVAWIAQEVFMTAAAWITWRRLRPPMRLSPFRATRAGLRRVVSLGGKFQLLSVLGIAIAQGFLFVLSGFFGPAVAGTYELANKIINFGRRAPMAIIGPLMPAFTDLHTRELGAEAREFYLRISRLLAVLTITVFGFIGLVPDLLIFGWTGAVRDPAPFMLVVLSLSAVVHMLTGVGTAALRGRENLGYEYRYLVVQAVVMVAAMIPLTATYGVRGMTVGYSVGFGIGSLWFLHAYARHEGIPFGAYARESLVRPLVRVVPVVAAFAALRFACPQLFAIGTSRWAVLGQVALLGAAFVVAVSVLVWRSGLLTQVEMGHVRRLRDRLLRRSPSPA